MPVHALPDQLISLIKIDRLIVHFLNDQMINLDQDLIKFDQS